MEFSKIFEFTQNKPADRLKNSLYLDKITHLLFKMTIKIIEKKYFFFNERHYPYNRPNNSFKKFNNDFLNVFRHSTGKIINYIVGIPGIGKTLFFNKQVKEIFRPETTISGKYFELCVDFRNIEQREKIEFYENFIYKELYDRATNVLKYYGEDNRKVFYREYRNSYKEFRVDEDDETTFVKLFPVMYFCKSIYNKHNQPAIITFDNIDLSCETTQGHIREAVVRVHRRLTELMEYEGIDNAYRIFFVIRPEFFMQTAEEYMINRINFPIPNILEITLDSLRKAITDAAKELDKPKTFSIDLTFESIIDGKERVVKNYSDIANYFIDIINHYLKEIWSRDDIISRLGTSQDFHCHLVNYNVRKFLLFICDTLQNGGFKPFTKDFYKRGKDTLYTVYDYLEMMVRGAWKMHPGNRFITGEGGNRAPIVFNVFDVTYVNGSKDKKIRHFMLYIRIMQWFYYSDDSRCKFCDIMNKNNGLVLFFDEDIIKDAIKTLIFVGILYSDEEGEKSIHSKKRASEIEINNENYIALSDMGSFYLEKLICEFEYLYQMALTSLMISKHVIKLKYNDDLPDKEETVYYFLESIYCIKDINFSFYNENALQVYDEKFLRSDGKAGQLYIKMIDTFILAMKGKINRAQKKYEENNEQHVLERLNKFKDISNNAVELKLKAVKHFIYKTYPKKT